MTKQELLCPLALFAPRHLPNLLRLMAYFARQFRTMPRERFAVVFAPYARRLSAEILPRFPQAAIEAAQAKSPTWMPNCLCVLRRWPHEPRSCNCWSAFRVLVRGADVAATADLVRRDGFGRPRFEDDVWSREGWADAPERWLPLSERERRRGCV